MSTTTRIVPKVWVGCLACYNAGALVGSWIDATDAAEVTPAQLHGGETDHEELWVFDTDSMPVQEEMSPQRATEWGELVDSLIDDEVGPFYAHVAGGDFDTAPATGLPTIADFRERYQGAYSSFVDYLQESLADQGFFRDVPSQFETYFDWDAYARDAIGQYTVADAPEHQVYIFRNW